MILSSFTTGVLILVILLILAFSTLLGSVMVAGWWMTRQMGLLSTQGGLLFAFEQFFTYLQQFYAGAPLHKWYTWEFPTRPGFGGRLSNSRFFMDLPVNKQRYIQYQRRPRDLNPKHFDTYVTISLPEIETVARQLRQSGQTRSYNTYDQLCNTLAFVQQSIRYTDDLSPQTGQLIEYPKYPLETLVDKKGDCEDQSILAAALLATMGYKVALLILPIHVAVGIADFDDKPGSRVVHPTTGVRYLYTETTAPNWLPGEVPPEFRGYLASGQFEVLPVNQHMVSDQTRPCQLFDNSGKHRLIKENR
jgi:transglutaminase-like putative cysteine protease